MHQPAHLAKRADAADAIGSRPPRRPRQAPAAAGPSSDPPGSIGRCAATPHRRASDAADITTRPGPAAPGFTGDEIVAGGHRARFSAGLPIGMTEETTLRPPPRYLEPDIALARIEALTTTARTTWLLLLGFPA